MATDRSSSIGFNTSKNTPKAEAGCRHPMTQDCVRSAAFDVFQTRVRDGLPGDCVSDWLQAERKLAARQSTTHATTAKT